MNISFTNALYQQVIEDCLSSAGELGKLLLREVDWNRCVYELLDVPGIKDSSTTNYAAHIVPHRGGPGAFRSPDNCEALASNLVDRQLSMLARDFALDRAHRLMPPNRVFSDGEAVYYLYDCGTDSFNHLLRVIRLASSWTFFGMAIAQRGISDVDMCDLQSLKKLLAALVFSAHGGDTYVVANELRWRNEGALLT